MLPINNLHLISDSTGETLESIINMLLIDFDKKNIKSHLWILIKNENEVLKIIEKILQYPGIVTFAFNNRNIQKITESLLIKNKIPFIDILKIPRMFFFKNFKKNIQFKKTEQYHLDDKYFKRIAAMEFTLSHDDGQRLWEFYQADVILFGVSRTSKTPTCMYLANKGIKACNIPFVSVFDINFFNQINNNNQLIIGLIKDAISLSYIRRKRLDIIGKNISQQYTDIIKIREELLMCEKLCRDNNWPIIDVSNLSIEETSANIIKLLKNKKENI